MLLKEISGNQSNDLWGGVALVHTHAHARAHTQRHRRATHGHTHTQTHARLATLASNSNLRTCVDMG